MKKRFLAVLLALSAAALAACFGGEEPSASSGSAVTSSSSAPEEASAPGESETAPLTEEEYGRFAAFLKGHVMADVFD